MDDAAHETGINNQYSFWTFSLDWYFCSVSYCNATNNIYSSKSITINNQYKTNKSPLTYYSLEKEATNILRYTGPDKKTL